MLVDCPECDGEGYEVCDLCGGDGHDEEGNDCPECEGTGASDIPCAMCGGTGEIEEDEQDYS